MKLAVDANVLFAALLKDGLTRRVWVKPALELYAPRFIVDEFASKRRQLKWRFHGTDEQLGRLAGKLLSYVSLVDDATLDRYLDPVRFLTPDPKDVLYLACAYHVGADLWTRDKGFSNQTRFKTWTTEQLAEEVGWL